MFYWLMREFFGFEYYGRRAVFAFLTAFFIAVVYGDYIVAWLRRRNIGERTDKTPIEDAELQAQIDRKAGTPTMGGLIILLALVVSNVLWGNLSDRNLWLALGCFVALALLGMVDDWKKLVGKGHTDRGVKVRHKLLVQGALGIVVGTLLVFRLLPGVHFEVPPLTPQALPMAVVGVLWFAVVIATMSNAVNVTDGLDGLAGILFLVALLPLAASCREPEQRELLVHCGALGGAVLGFLWHNWHPARVFMGDTGSLALGGSLGLLALLTRTDLLLPVFAFVFLVEFGSSVLQVLWFRATGRRLLPIAPLHHVFQKMGWAETHIVFRFLVVGVLVLVAAIGFGLMQAGL